MRRAYVAHVQSAANLQPQPANPRPDGGFVDITDRDLGAQTLRGCCDREADSASPTTDGDYLFGDLRCDRHSS